MSEPKELEMEIDDAVVLLSQAIVKLIAEVKELREKVEAMNG